MTVRYLWGTARGSDGHSTTLTREAQEASWGFRVDGFLPALLGALIVSFVSFVLSHMLRKSL